MQKTVGWLSLFTYGAQYSTWTKEGSPKLPIDKIILQNPNSLGGKELWGN